MPKNRYVQVLQKQIEDARQKEHDKCWRQIEQVVELLMLAVTVELNDQCGLGRERIQRVNNALGKTIEEYGRTDDRGYFIHCLAREYKRLMGVEYHSAPGVEIEVEF